MGPAPLRLMRSKGFLVVPAHPPGRGAGCPGAKALGGFGVVVAAAFVSGDPAAPVLLHRSPRDSPVGLEERREGKSRDRREGGVGRGADLVGKRYTKLGAVESKMCLCGV